MWAARSFTIGSCEKAWLSMALCHVVWLSYLHHIQPGQQAGGLWICLLWPGWPDQGFCMAKLVCVCWLWVACKMSNLSRACSPQKWLQRVHSSSSLNPASQKLICRTTIGVVPLCNPTWWIWSWTWFKVLDGHEQHKLISLFCLFYFVFSL